MSKSIERKYKSTSKKRKRPAWMEYVKDAHEAVIFAKVADELGTTVPRMMRDATIKLINEAMDQYSKANPAVLDKQEEATNE